MATPSVLDDVARIGVAVLRILKPAHIPFAVERLWIALLLVCSVLLSAPREASQHGRNVPRASLH